MLPPLKKGKLDICLIALDASSHFQLLLVPSLLASPAFVPPPPAADSLASPGAEPVAFNAIDNLFKYRHVKA